MTMIAENSLDKDGEIWKAVIGYENLYEISNYGRLKSLKRTARLGTSIRNVNERIKAIVISSVGYVHYIMSKDGKNKIHLAHRVVAQHFIPNPLNLSQINHKDGIKTNNYVQNLEWCDGFHNHRHAVRMGLQKAAKGKASGLSFKGTIFVYKDGIKIDELNGRKDMEDKGYNSASVYKVVLGYHKTYKNLTFIRQSK